MTYQYTTPIYKTIIMISLYHFPVTIMEDQQVRATTLYTKREPYRPRFMPVGTQGAIRALSPLHLKDTNSQIILANTYHLSQRPGHALVAKMGLA